MDSMMVQQIAAQVIMMALTGVVGWLGGKLKGVKTERERREQEQEQATVQTKAMLKLLLYYQLRELFNTYVVDKKPISSADKREIEELYGMYHDTLSGNGEGTRMYKELMELKTE